MSQTIPLAKMSDINAGITPGPWEVVPHPGGRPGIEAKDCSVVVFGADEDDAGIYGRDDDSAEALANAHLIAAAPDMLAALESFANPKNWVLNGCFDPNSGNFEGIRFAAAAIRKATGQS